MPLPPTLGDIIVITSFYDTEQHPPALPTFACQELGSGGADENGSGVSLTYPKRLSNAVEYICTAKNDPQFCRGCQGRRRRLKARVNFSILFARCAVDEDVLVDTVVHTVVHKKKLGKYSTCALAGAKRAERSAPK